MPKLEHTSVPLWATAGPTVAPEPDRGGASYLLVGVGAQGREQVAAWADALSGLPVARVVGDHADSVGVDLAAALAEAQVGVRVRIAGPVSSCLALRGVAVNAGVEDDELHVAATGKGTIDVWCSHCTSTSAVEAEIDDVVRCRGCGRSLLVYHHVSRRTGRFLGFQIDAETLPDGLPAEVAS